MIILVVTEAMLAAGAASFERIISEMAYDEQFQARMKANTERAMKSLDDYALRQLGRQTAKDVQRELVLKQYGYLFGDSAVLLSSCSNDMPALKAEDFQPLLDKAQIKSEPLSVSMYWPADEPKLRKPKMPEAKYKGYYKNANKRRY